MLDAAKANQLWDVDDFRQRKHDGHGVIVIFDRVRDAPIAHVPACRHVTEDRFAVKMIEMDGKNGRYWWFERFSDAQRDLGARRGVHCG
jgi:hypothetical protein